MLAVSWPFGRGKSIWNQRTGQHRGKGVKVDDTGKTLQQGKEAGLDSISEEMDETHIHSVHQETGTRERGRLEEASPSQYQIKLNKRSVDLLRAEVHKMPHTFQELLLKSQSKLWTHKIQAIIFNTQRIYKWYKVSFRNKLRLRD